MGTTTIIAIIEGILQGIPQVVSAYQAWVTAVNTGTDPTPAQLALTEAAVDALYAKVRNNAQAVISGQPVATAAAATAQ